METFEAWKPSAFLRPRDTARRLQLQIAAGCVVAALVGGLTPAALPGAPSPDRTLFLAVSHDLTNIDPTSTSSDPLAFGFEANVYGRLINLKVQRDASRHLVGLANEFVPEVAQSFTFEDGGKRLVVRLRDGIKFSNGDPLDAAAVKFTYDRMFDSKSTSATLHRIAQIISKDSVRVTDDHTVEFAIEKPNPLVLGTLALGALILNPRVVKPNMTAADPYAHEWLKANSKGTEAGPYMLESWQPGVQFALARNPNWWGRPPKTDRIVYRIVPDPITRVSLLRSGAVDVAEDIAFKDVHSIETDPVVRVYRFQSNIVSFLGMNAAAKPFDNVLVRQAVDYAIPYDTIIHNVLYGFGTQLKSVIASGTPTFTDRFFVYRTDPARAKQLLTQAGYRNVLQITLSVRSDLTESKGVAVWVKSALARAGIDVAIQELPGAVFTAALQKHELAFFHHPGWLSNINDPFYHYSWLLASNCCDYTNFHNKEVEDLIAKYTAGNDLAARAAASRRIQEIALKDAVWGLLYQPDIVLVTRRTVRDVVYYQADRFWRWKDTYKQ